MEWQRSACCRRQLDFLYCLLSHALLHMWCLAHRRLTGRLLAQPAAWGQITAPRALDGHARLLGCSDAPARGAFPLARGFCASPAAVPHNGDAAQSAQSLAASHDFSVKAFYIAQRIDLAALAKAYTVTPHTSVQHRDSLVVRLEKQAAGGGASFPYVAVTGYGSCVFFDVSPEDRASFLTVAAGCATKLLPQPCVDDLRVAVRPGLSAWSSLAADTLSLRELDANSLRVVSSVLAQSVALNHFEGKVDGMLEVFSALNADMERTAGALSVPRERLFQLVAENNNVMMDVLARVGLLSRSDAAWAAAHYHQVFDALREDFELDERFENLHFKLDLIAKQLHFNLEMLQNRKSDRLEYIIILLISCEVIISLSDKGLFS